MANPNPNAATRFKPANSDGLATRWPPGQTGNPNGVSRLRREFEEKFYAALLTPEMAEAAERALKKAINGGESWAVLLYYNKALPAQPIDLRVSRGDEPDEQCDYSRLSNTELTELIRLLEIAAGDTPALEAGSGGAESS